MSKLRYDLIVSIGEDCACTTYLRKHDLQAMSYPFDWLTGAPYENRIDAILNDFSGFLDKDDFQFIEKNKNEFNDSICDYYGNVKNGFYFYHDFPIGTDFEIAFPKVKDKYQRRISRFYKAIAHSEKVLLVWFSHTQQIDEILIIESHRKIENKFNKKIDFLIIQNDDTKQPNEIENITPVRGVTICKLKTIEYDEDNKLEFLGNKRNCSRVFRKYALNEPLNKRMIRYWKKMVLRPILSLIPYKPLRRKLKKLYL